MAKLEKKLEEDWCRKRKGGVKREGTKELVRKEGNKGRRGGREDVM